MLAAALIEVLRLHELQAGVLAGVLGIYAVTEFAGRRSTWKQGAPMFPRSSVGERTYFVIVTAALACLGIDLAVFFLGVPELLPSGTLLVGVTLAAMGFGLRYWSMRTLGRFYTNPVTIRDDHELIRNGPYRWIRHPVYTGGLLVLVAFPLILGSVLSLALTLLLCLTVYIERIGIEEAALVARFGDAYTKYSERTYRLLPGLF